MTKEKRYRVSVLMGIYNCASTLQEALDSLYAQTFQDFKIILCDDGSKDNSLQIALQNADVHSNIIVIRNITNIKLAATLNHCLKYADTEYVARMDGDDLCDPTRFEKEILFLDNHPEYALVSCPMVYFDENGEWKKGKAVERPQKNDFRKSTPFCHAPMMMRTSVLKEIGGYTVAKKTERMEDYYLWYKVYRSGYVGYNIQEHLYSMRDGRDAIARRRPSDRLRGFKTDIEIAKGLGLSLYWLFPLLNLLKVLVPNHIVHFIHYIKR